MPDALGEAIEGLKRARNEALARLAAIDHALINLGALSELSRPFPADAKQTLADAIVRLLRERGGEWDAAAIVRALREESFHGLNEADPIAGVRTALSRLVRAGRLVRPRYGYYAVPGSMKDLMIESLHYEPERPKSSAELRDRHGFDGSPPGERDDIF